MEYNKLKRVRKTKNIRDLAAATRITGKDLIMPLFVKEGKNKAEEISSMPGIYRYSIDRLLPQIEELCKLGVPGILLFGVIKDRTFSGQVSKEAYSNKGIVQRAVKEIKDKFPGLTVFTDVCLCGYTEHGHCGVLKKEKGDIDLGKTLKILSKTALSHARAGADFVAPSAMADGQVKAIRKILDKKGFQDTGILGYSAKYASNFYGPFRDACHSSPSFGDRKSYQMDFRNSRSALEEVRSDIEEGTDIVMVKPALAYLDIINRVRAKFDRPLAAYSVSGEYAAVKAAADKGWIQEKETALEILTSIKRAGADIIITYWSKEAAKWIKR